MIVTKILSRLSRPANKPIDYDAMLPSVPYELGIPKSIMQTCRKKEDLPDEILENIRKICSQNPEWSYYLYEDPMIEDYISRNYGETILDYYKRISDEYGAAKADLFRYLYVYHEGGIYLDIKSSIATPLEGSIRADDSFLLSYWDNLEGQKHQGVGHYSDVFKDYPRGEIPQWFIIASKGHPLLRDIIIQVLKNIDNYNPYVNGVGWSGTVHTTGPVPYSLAIYDRIPNYDYRLVDAFSEIGMVYSIYEDSHKSGPYHAKAIKSDYRKGVKPLIRHRCSVLEKVNEMYLREMSRRRKH